MDATTKKKTFGFFTHKGLQGKTSRDLICAAWNKLHLRDFTAATEIIEILFVGIYPNNDYSHEIMELALFIFRVYDVDISLLTRFYRYIIQFKPRVETVLVKELVILYLRENSLEMAVELYKKYSMELRHKESAELKVFGGVLYYFVCFSNCKEIDPSSIEYIDFHNLFKIDFLKDFYHSNSTESKAKRFKASEGFYGNIDRNKKKKRLKRYKFDESKREKVFAELKNGVNELKTALETVKIKPHNKRIVLYYLKAFSEDFDLSGEDWEKYKINLQCYIGDESAKDSIVKIKEESKRSRK